MISHYIIQQPTNSNHQMTAVHWISTELTLILTARWFWEREQTLSKIIRISRPTELNFCWFWDILVYTYSWREGANLHVRIMRIIRPYGSISVDVLLPKRTNIYIFIYIPRTERYFWIFFKYHCVLALSASIEYICYVSMAIINIQFWLLFV